MTTTKTHSKPASPDRLRRNGRQMVLLEESEYDRLLQKADEWEPLLPEPLPNGNYPAVEYLRASLARKIIRARRRAGLTQVELARRAGIRPETLNRIEKGKSTPDTSTVEKLVRALERAEATGVEKR